MDIQINPGTLKGTLEAISSKSELHRMLICATFADQPTDIIVSGSAYDGQHELPKDIQATLSCLTAIGAQCQITPGMIRVIPVSKETLAGEPVLDCMESGSTFRFMLPIAAAVCGKASFSGGGRLPERPIAGLSEALKAHGVQFSGESLPFSISGTPDGGVYEIPGNISSQYLTGLLLMLPLLEEKASIRLTTPLVSSGYIDITTQVMSSFGVDVLQKDGMWQLSERHTYRSPVNIPAGGDWSNTAAFLTASMLREGNDIRCKALLPDSCQGDRNILRFLEQFGAGISATSEGLRTAAGILQGTTIDIDETPDLLPYLAVVGCVAVGDTIFTNAARLRLKESDRITSTASMIHALGGSVEAEADKLIVHGVGSLRGGTVDAMNDHRIVMAGAVASSICREPVIIQGAEAVNKSYPTFFEDFASVKGDCHVL